MELDNCIYQSNIVFSDKNRYIYISNRQTFLVTYKLINHG